MNVPVKRALLSVSGKAGIAAFARELAARGVEILSTGGTARALREAGIAVLEVEDYTGFPEMLDGRVKTLHPKVHGGLLGKRGDPEHARAMERHGIGGIDLLAVTLYPFEETAARGADFCECVENIDIGGPAMIRSAAKNHESVTVITDPADYAPVLEEMAENGGATTAATRKALAAKAFARTAAYDAAIARWFAGILAAPAPTLPLKGEGGEREALAGGGGNFPTILAAAATLKQTLRYGENPHQRAAFYVTDENAPGVASAAQLQGKELSYNNINDTDAAFALVREFAPPACVIVKHANPCGAAVADSPEEAYRKALACDPLSAYGGILAFNRPLDLAAAEAIGNLFAEVVIAPGIEEAARDLLAKKKNLRLLVTNAFPLTRSRDALAAPSPQPSPPGGEGWGEGAAALQIRSVAGGLLAQEEDAGVLDEEQLKTVSRRAPTQAEMADMRFAFAVAKHVKSNAIVLARGGATVGIGAGQMSRVDSVRIACWKAEAATLSTQGAVLASDAFFPFDDNVHMAAKAGITAIIQPGGSIRDEDVIAATDSYGMAMVFTGIRHFRH